MLSIIGFCADPANPTSDAGLANGRPTHPPELFGVRGGVGFPGTGLWWKGTEMKVDIMKIYFSCCNTG